MHSRAAKRASSPSIDTDKSIKEVKPPVAKEQPSVLAIHQGAGVTKKNKHGRKAVLSAKAKKRQESAMDRAEAFTDKKAIAVEKSKDRGRTVFSRRHAWEEQNRRLQAKKEQEQEAAAMAVDQDRSEDESVEGEPKFAAIPNDVEDPEPGVSAAAPAAGLQPSEASKAFAAAILKGDSKEGSKEDPEEEL